MSKDSLESKTKEELLALAKKNDIQISRSLLKREVIALLKRALIKNKPKTAVAVVTKAKKSTKTSSLAKPLKKETPKKTKTVAPKKVLSRKKRVASSAKVSSGHIEDMAQEAKFVIGRPPIKDETQGEFTPELPMNYGYNKLVLMVRDPYWVYSYWEIQQDKIKEGLKALAKPLDQTRWVLRVFTTRSDGKSQAPSQADVEIQPHARNWYLHLSPAGASFYAEIGLMDRQNNFYCLTTSNAITLPPDRPSDIIDEQWMTCNEEFQKLYAFSSGDQLGGGSEMIQKGQAFPLSDSSWGLSRSSFMGHPSGKSEDK